MSIGYSNNGKFHAPISPEVIKQLSLRSQITSKRAGRGTEDITYLNSNTGWIKVTSAVDLDEIELGEKQPAGEYILYGGTYSETFGTRKGFKQSIDGSFLDNSSYTYSETNGIVPMPGITSFNIQSKDFYGSIRGASINFSVHSKEDFDKLETLYLRPGFSILVEWGHSIVLDNETAKIQTLVSEYPTKDFLVKQDYFDIINQINKLRGPDYNSYNYDAFYGWITNFAWSYNGYSYECQVDMLSAGSFLLALQAGYPTVGKTEEGQEDDYQPKKYSTQLESILSAISDAQAPSITPDSEFTQADRDKVIENIKLNLQENVSNYANIFEEGNFLIGYFSDPTNSAEISSGGTKYITLRDLFKSINQIGLFRNKEGNNIISLNTETVIPFTTFPEHNTNNPLLFVLPKTSVNDFTLNLATQLTTLDPTDILNIFVNVDYLSHLLTLIGKKESKYETFHNFITLIINKLNDSLGGVNMIDLLFDEDVSQFYLVDRSVVPGTEDLKLDGNNKPKSFIDLVGLGAEVTNLNVVSNIDSDLSSMIAIAAQAGPSSETSKYILNTQQWSRGLKDRHFPEKSEGSNNTKVSTVDESNLTTTPSTDITEEYKVFIKKLNKANNFAYIGLDGDVFEGYKTIHQKFTIQKLSEITTSENKNFAGILPFTLNFTIKGISGLKIGNVFKINEFFLPERYQNKVAFAITGLDSKVENNQWTTDVKAYMIPL